jgi:hypothetical protein
MLWLTMYRQRGERAFVSTVVASAHHCYRNSLGPQENDECHLNTLGRSGLLTGGLDYHAIRASMVDIFLFFRDQEWFDYEAQVLISFIVSHVADSAVDL